MHPDELRALAVQLACTSLAFSQKQLTQVENLAYSIAAFSQHKWEELISCAVASSSPLLYCHGSDGWTRIISETVQVKLDQHMIKRHGKLRTEFNLERKILKKTMPDTSISPWHLHHPGPCSMASQDGISSKLPSRRGTCSAPRPHTTSSCIFMSRTDCTLTNSVVAKLVGMSYFTILVYDADRKDLLAAEKDIVLCWRCTLHVASSGIHWGQLNATPSSSTLDDIHMGIKSLRNSSLTILELVDPFVQEYARFNRNPPADAQHVEVLWRVLGVSGHMLTIVVEMDPFWNAADRVLEVSRRFEVDPKRYEKVANVLLFFTSGGWASRNLVGLVLPGRLKNVWHP